MLITNDVKYLKIFNFGKTNFYNREKNLNEAIIPNSILSSI